jgi:hypothetical protein
MEQIAEHRLTGEKAPLCPLVHSRRDNEIFYLILVTKEPFAGLTGSENHK